MASSQPKGRLLRILGVGFGIAVIVGDMIGSDILRTPGEVAGYLGSRTLIIGIWLIGALFALFRTLSVTELGTMLPFAGGWYVHWRRAMGDFAGFVDGCSDLVMQTATTAYAGGTVKSDLGTHDLYPALEVLFQNIRCESSAPETGPVRRFMKLMCCWFALAASLLVTWPAWAQSKPPATDQILPLLTEQLVAANAHDTDRFLATYLHSPELIFIANGQIFRGWDNLRDQQLKWWKNGKSDVVYTQQLQPEVTVLDSQTVLVTQQMTSRRTLPDGKPTDGTFIISSIWRKLPVGWRVTYGHESDAR